MIKFNPTFINNNVKYSHKEVWTSSELCEKKCSYGDMKVNRDTCLQTEQTFLCKLLEFVRSLLKKIICYRYSSICPVIIIIENQQNCNLGKSNRDPKQISQGIDPKCSSYPLVINASDCTPQVFYPTGITTNSKLAHFSSFSLIYSCSVH